VADDVQRLRLALGTETLELDVAGLLAGADASARSPAIRSGPTTGSASESGRRLPAPGAPVRLEIDLVDSAGRPFGDGAIDAGESGRITLEVRNRGAREASGVVVAVEPAVLPRLVYPGTVEVASIPAGGSRRVELPVLAEPGLLDGTVHLTFRAREPYGHDSPAIELELPSRSAPAARLVLTEDFLVEGSGVPVPRDTVVTVRLRVRNVGQGTARDVEAWLGPAEDVYSAGDGADRFELGTLAPGEVAEIPYRCFANQHAEQLGIRVELSDAASREAPTRSLLVLPLEDGMGVARIVRVQAEPPEAPPTLAPPPPPLASDVDRVVPPSGSSRPDALAVVLGVERYASAPRASYAAEDARTAARYFEHTLGIPAPRIQLLVDGDVTLGQMHRIFGPDGWIARRANEDSQVFVFFAGHGVSTGAGFAPYLVPADGDLNYVEQTGLPLDRLIEWLLALDNRSTTLFIDACFSGLTREGQGLFEAARPLVVTPSRRRPSGLSLYSAARGTQLAAAYDEQGHGLFSYYLFRGLGGAADLNGDGAILAAELERYLEREVAIAALELDREQDPAIFLRDPAEVLVELR
jgi:hypothetical protein